MGSTTPLSERVAGIDGCRGGWVVVTAPLEGDGPYDVRAVADLRSVLADVDAGRLRAVAIDIPIGLPESGPRVADVEARRRVGPRRNSVFPAPARAVIGATTYADACARSRQASGKAISKQLFNILGKIAEVDALMTPTLQDRVVEMFPEWSLTVLAGAPMAHPKSTAAGRAERAAALGTVFDRQTLETQLRHPPRGARADDVLDALAGAWTARRLARGTAERVGGGVDARGLRMEVVA
jgi:predicted RNase H-like nuclease